VIAAGATLCALFQTLWNGRELFLEYPGSYDPHMFEVLEEHFRILWFYYSIVIPASILALIFRGIGEILR